MKALRVIETLIVFFTSCGIIFGAYLYLDGVHAKRANVTRVEIDLRSDIIDRDIKRDAEARVYYQNIESSRGLQPPEQRRKDYLEENLDRKYEEQRSIQTRKSELMSTGD
jgi:hypothetical protein